MPVSEAQLDKFFSNHDDSKLCSSNEAINENVEVVNAKDDRRDNEGLQLVGGEFHRRELCRNNCCDVLDATLMPNQSRLAVRCVVDGDAHLAVMFENGLAVAEGQWNRVATCNFRTIVFMTNMTESNGQFASQANI